MKDLMEKIKIPDENFNKFYSKIVEFQKKQEI